MEKIEDGRSEGGLVQVRLVEHAEIPGGRDGEVEEIRFLPNLLQTFER